MLLLAFGLFSCRGLETAKKADQRLREVAAGCGVDLKTLDWTQKSGSSSFSDSRKGFAAKLSELKDLMAARKIGWEVNFSEDIRSSCPLKRSEILSSPGMVGFVDHMHWAMQSLLVREGLPVQVSKVRIIVSALKNTELYHRNEESRPYTDRNGFRMIDYYVNLGDPKSGLSFASLIRNLTARDLVFKEVRSSRLQAR